MVAALSIRQRAGVLPVVTMHDQIVTMRSKPEKAVEVAELKLRLTA